MAFLDLIYSYLNAIGDWFWQAYVEVYGWAYPFNRLATPLYYVASNFWSFALRWIEFSNWIVTAVNSIAAKVDWTGLYSWFNQYLSMIVGAWNWVYQAVSNVTSIVNTWWSSTITTVQGWITAATQGLAGMLSAWSNFVMTTLPSLVSFSGLNTWWTGQLVQVSSIIDSAFTLRSNLWEGWQEVKNDIIGFIATPFDWLLDRFTDWFWGDE